MDLVKKNWKTVLIAILAILAVVFGILFIDGNSAKNDLDDELQSLKTTSKKALQEAKDEAEEAAAQAKSEAETALNEAVDAVKAEAATAQEKADKALKSAESKLDTTTRREKANRAELRDAKNAIAEMETKIAAQDELLEDARPYLEGEVTAQAEAALKEAVDAAKAEAATAQEAAVKEAVEAAQKEAAEAAAKAKEEADAALTAAVDAARKEAEDAAAKAKENADAELKAAVAKAEADAQVKIDELNVKLKDTEKLLEDAKSALEGENADKAAAIDAAKKEAEEAAAKAKEASDAAVAAAVDAAKAEAATAQEAAVKEAVAAAKKEADEAAAKAKEEADAALKAAQDQIADLEAKVKDLEGAKAAPEAPKAMTHEEYVAAALESEVCIETFVQATQAWWDGKITVYAQSKDGAYFIYNMTCSEDDAKKLVPGTPIRVKGYKAEWSGEIEIVDAAFEIIEGEAFIAEAEDVTDKLGTDELINCQNELVAFKGLTVEAQDDGAAVNYKNAEEKTDDLYFRVSKDGKTYDFCVEFYLCGKDTEVYKAVEALQVGDVIDAEGFLYWYNGLNPHITKVTKTN